MSVPTAKGPTMTDQMLADANLGRALREAAEVAGRTLAEQYIGEFAEGVEHDDSGAHVADYANWEDDVLASEGATALRDIVAAAAQEVADEAREMRHQHAERDREHGVVVPLKEGA